MIPYTVSMKEFTKDWFEHNVPHLTQWLAPFAGRPGLRVLEIGSFEGRSTNWFAENILTAGGQIDCIDLFESSATHGDFHARFRANTAAHRHMIREFPGHSFDGLRRVEGPYDIVYVDGWHSAFGALADGVMAWPLLKVGGVMVFDDYLWFPPEMGEPVKPSWLRRHWIRLTTGKSWYRAERDKRIASAKTETPKLGVDGMLATLEGYYEVIGVSNQLAIRKTRDFAGEQARADT